MNEAELDQPWDPSPLRIGERVRVRLSGECPGRGYKSYPPREHDDQENGKEEIVQLVSPYGGSHPYLLLFRDGPRLPITQWRLFARAELERLEAPS